MLNALKDSGNSRLVKLLHFKNASAPIFSRLSGSVIVVRSLQLSNALASISVHTLPSSKLISVTAEQDKNALEPTVSVRLSIVTTPLFAGGQKMSVVKSLLYNIPLAEA